MTTEDLQAWLAQESLDDQWWVAQDGQMLEQPMTLAEVEAAAAAAPGATYSLLHVAYAEEESAPWMPWDPPLLAPQEPEQDTPFKVSSNQPAFLQKKQAAKQVNQGAAKAKVKQEESKLGVTDEQRSYLVRYRLVGATGINNLSREVAAKLIGRHTIKRRILKVFSALFSVLMFAALCWGTWFTYDYLNQNPVSLATIPEVIVNQRISPEVERLGDFVEETESNKFDATNQMTQRTHERILRMNPDFRYVRVYEEPMPLSRSYQYDRFEKQILKSRDAKPLFFQIRHEKSGKLFDVVSTIISEVQLELNKDKPIKTDILSEIYIVKNFDELGFK